MLNTVQQQAKGSIHNYNVQIGKLKALKLVLDQNQTATVEAP